jgi:uncharacterized protein YegP (UPF0339 family)
MRAILRKTEASEPFIFRITDDNETIILKSENYKTRKSAENGVNSVMKNRTTDKRYEPKTSTNGKFFFNLKATNGQVIGTSPLYATEAERETVIAMLKDEAQEIVVDDQIDGTTEAKKPAPKKVNATPIVEEQKEKKSVAKETPKAAPTKETAETTEDETTILTKVQDIVKTCSSFFCSPITTVKSWWEKR